MGWVIHQVMRSSRWLYIGQVLFLRVYGPRRSRGPSFRWKLDALLRVPRQSLYWEALAILQLSLNVLYLKSCESMCSSYSAFDCISWNRLIAYYSFTALYHVKWVKIVMSAYERFSLFSLAFAVVVVCFISQTRETFEFPSYGGSWHRATLGSVNLFKIIRGISQVWENAQT